MVVQLVAGAADLREPRRRRSVGIADELEQDLGSVQLNGVRHRRAGLPHHGEHLELGYRPLSGEDFPAETRAVGHGPRLPAPAYPSTFDVTGVPVEHPVLAAAVSLGGHQRSDVGARNGPLDEVDVSLLAGLEYAEFVVDGAEGGDHPIGVWLGAVWDPDVVPGRPAGSLRRAVGVLSETRSTALLWFGVVPSGPERAVGGAGVVVPVGRREGAGQGGSLRGIAPGASGA